MNVSPAMIASETKTLAELSDHLYKMLHVPVEQRLTPEFFKPDGKRVCGYFPAVAAHLKREVDGQSNTRSKCLTGSRSSSPM